jgi:hypothetical protein
MDLIDDYLRGNTLSKNEKFTSFMDEFSNKANVTVFVQTPKLYAHLMNYGKEETRIGLKKNRELILSFSLVGFQMVSDGKEFTTTLITNHDEDALFDETIDNIEHSAEDLFIWEIDSMRYKKDIPLHSEMGTGLYKDFYSDSSEGLKMLKAEGMISDGVPNGLWKIYYESGNLKSIILFKEGKADGLVTFFYDNAANTKKIDVNIKEDVIEGEYSEYYTNGSKKAVIMFQDGMMNGDATFYYDRGILKAEGSYKDGEKAGKWKYYSETGEVISKEKWKKGNMK